MTVRTWLLPAARCAAHADTRALRLRHRADNQGRWGEYRIDFTALAKHLDLLHRAATARGIDLPLVIADKPLLPQLLGKRPAMTS